jgi:DNA uptake protein ComE-like DNA-binding protein
MLEIFSKVFLFTIMAVIIAGTSCAYAMEKVNINTAPVEQLIQLDRIGMKICGKNCRISGNSRPF